MLNNVAMPGFALGAMPSQTPQPTGAGPSSAANPSHFQAAPPTANFTGTQWSGVKRLTCNRDLLALLIHSKTPASLDDIKNISCESMDPQTGTIALPAKGWHIKLTGEALSLLTEYLYLRQQNGYAQTGPLLIDTRSNETKSLSTQTLGTRARHLRRKVESNDAASAPADLKSLYFAAMASPTSITARAGRPADNTPANAESASAAGDAAAAAIEGLAAESLIELRNSPVPQAAEAPPPQPGSAQANLSRIRPVVAQQFGGERAPQPIPLPVLDNWSAVPRDGLVSLLQRAGFRPIHALARSGDAAALQQHLGQANLSGLATPSPHRHRTPLHHAVESGQLANVRQLVNAIKQSPNPGAINYPDSAGMTPLHLAGHVGQIDAFKLLLEAGGKMNGPAVRASGLAAGAVTALAQTVAEKYDANQQRKQQLAQDQSKKRSLSELMNNTDRGE